MNSYVPEEFTKRVRNLINKKIGIQNNTDYIKAYKQEHLNMCVAIGVSDTFLADIEKYEQRPRHEILEKMSAYFSVRITYLLLGE